jgi:hypothetical protein
MNVRLVLLVVVLVASFSARGDPSAAAGGQALGFLIGTWVSEEGGGTPGKATRGETSFQRDVGEHVVVRRNFAEYPAMNGKPAYRHDDLTVIYALKPGAPARAKYFDSEGHVIDYTVTDTGDRLVFLGDVVSNAPRFRLTYRKLEDGRVAGEFEIAKPQSPEAFERYLAWTMKRVN